jgi:hypothetical protein
VLFGDGEDYCERVRGSFERTTKWARELAAALEALDVDGMPATVARLDAVRHGLEQEIHVLQSSIAPLGAEAVQFHGDATLRVLLSVADPALVDRPDDERAEVAQFLRDQFLAARAEARAAAAALRQVEPNCGARGPQGALRLLGRSR